MNNYKKKFKKNWSRNIYVRKTIKRCCEFNVMNAKLDIN